MYSSRQEILNLFNFLLKQRMSEDEVLEDEETINTDDELDFDDDDDGIDFGDDDSLTEEEGGLEEFSPREIE